MWPWRRARSTSPLEARGERAPVGEPRQRVGVDQPVELGPGLGIGHRDRRELGEGRQAALVGGAEGAGPRRAGGRAPPTGARGSTAGWRCRCAGRRPAPRATEASRRRPAVVVHPLGLAGAGRAARGGGAGQGDHVRHGGRRARPAGGTRCRSPTSPTRSGRPRSRWRPAGSPPPGPRRGRSPRGRPRGRRPSRRGAGRPARPRG